MNVSHLKNISLYAVSLFLIKGVSLFTLPLMAQYLSPQEIGHLELLGITTVFFSLIVGIAMHEKSLSIYRHNQSLHGAKKKSFQLYSASLVVSFSLSLLSCSFITWLPFKLFDVHQ
ncbi:hypothetical protein P4S64_06845 [Vibrio sp. M60_M31a]